MHPNTTHQNTQTHGPTAAHASSTKLVRETDRRQPRSNPAAALISLAKLLARQAAAEVLISVPVGAAS